MAFNPLNLQLQRDTAGIKRRHSYIQLRPSTIFGRSSISDVKLFGRKISKRHCTITFRDGVPFITDFSTNGTFVNNVRVEVETALSENDRISLGIHPDIADAQNQETYLFNLVRQEVVELDDDSDDEDVQIIEVDSGNESGDVRELQRSPDEEITDRADDAGVDVGLRNEASEEEQSNEAFQVDDRMDEADVEDIPMSAADEEDNPMNEEEIPMNKDAEEKSSDPNAQDNWDQPSTSQNFVNSIATSILQKMNEYQTNEHQKNLRQKLKEKQENLRHWNMSKIPIIDPLPMKTGRKKKEPQEPIAGPSGVNLAQGEPKKRGRPRKITSQGPKKSFQPTKELKERLAAIAPPLEEKPKEPKPHRDIKIKITKNNRGYFLSKPSDQSPDDTSEDTE